MEVKCNLHISTQANDISFHLLTVCSVIAGDTDALKDCWLVGDELLQEIFTAF